MAVLPRSHFSIGSLSDVRQNLDPIVNCMKSQMPYAITVPREFRHYEEMKRMIARRNEPEKNRRTRLQALRDSYRHLRAQYFFSLLAAGFGNDAHTWRVEEDDRGITVLFDPISRAAT